MFTIKGWHKEYNQSKCVAGGAYEQKRLCHTWEIFSADKCQLVLQAGDWKRKKANCEALVRIKLQVQAPT